MKPFFSIVVATYNRAQFLPVTIGSIQAQDFTDFELLIVDDGSKDNTREVIDVLMQTDKRIKYIYQENKERGAARNLGLKNALGDYVLFFDSDDFMKKNHLENMHQLILENPDCNFYASKFLFKEKNQLIEAPVCQMKSGKYGIDFVLSGNPVATLFVVKRSNPSLKFFPEDRNFATMEDWMCLVYNLYDQKIVLGDFVGSIMHNHDSRSMMQNQLVIERRLRAAYQLISDLNLTSSQKKELLSHSFSFCAVHSYLDFKRQQALGYIWKALKTNGVSKNLMMLTFKILVGKKIINRIKMW